MLSLTWEQDYDALNLETRIGQEIFADIKYICGWTHAAKIVFVNNHCYTAHMRTHQPRDQCLRIISLIHCNGASVNIFDC